LKNFLLGLITSICCFAVLTAFVYACDSDYNPFIINNGTHNSSSVSTSGIMGSSQMVGYNAPTNLKDNLGTVSFATGKLTSGTLVVNKLMQGALFSSTGSSFYIVGNGTNGVPNGTVFSGTFTGTVKWEYTNVIWNTYALVGNIKGKLVVDGKTVTVKKGNTAQCFTYANGTFTLIGGLTDIYY